MTMKPEHQDVYSEPAVPKGIDKQLSQALHHYVKLHHAIELARWEMEHAEQEHIKTRLRCVLSGDPIFGTSGAEQELKDLAIVIASVGQAELTEEKRALTEGTTRADPSEKQAVSR